MDIPRMSKALYMTLCLKIGFPTAVTIRREVAELEEKINTLKCPESKTNVLRTGSNSEGFRLPGSDVDFMFWPTDYKVIYEYNQSYLYRLSDTKLIMMECCCTRPGFALLKLHTPSNDKYFKSACIRMNDGLYISSCLYREVQLRMKMCYIHGPCSRTGLRAMIEYDFANSFSCAFWPPVANEFVERSHIKGWPTSSVLQEIVNYGCHVVPKGRKYSPQEHMEWLISFSVAERKLVYAMTHCQFLCYGMLKLFLKDVIVDNTEEPLLCSYFMKTIIFWEIQEQKIQTWSPQNILLCIWQCVKRLIKLVEIGECPNFFVPANNMFSDRVVGFARTRLLSQLYDVYNQGMSCLFTCESIRSIIQNFVALSPTVEINTNENDWFSLADKDTCLFSEIDGMGTDSVSNLKLCNDTLSALNSIGQTQLSVYQILALEAYKSKVLLSVAFHVYEVNSTTSDTNKIKYSRDKIACQLIKYAAKFGDVSSILYIAMYYYMTVRYKQTARYVKIAKMKLSQPYIMRWSTVDKKRYNEVAEGKSLSTRMRECYASDVIIHFRGLFIRELTLEIQVIERRTGDSMFYIAPHVMASMLSVLCHRDNPRKQEEDIYDLHTLIMHDDGKYIDSSAKGIAWHILGICQQIYGDLHGALFSYQESLKCTGQQLHEIHEATKTRIQTIRLALDKEP